MSIVFLASIITGGEEKQSRCAKPTAAHGKYVLCRLLLYKGSTPSMQRRHQDELYVQAQVRWIHSPMNRRWLGVIPAHVKVLRWEWTDGEGGTLVALVERVTAPPPAVPSRLEVVSLRLCRVAQIDGYTAPGSLGAMHIIPFPPCGPRSAPSSTQYISTDRRSTAFLPEPIRYTNESRPWPSVL